MGQTVELPHGSVEPGTEARYLGVILDQSLRWWPHVQHVRAKATTTLAALRSLAGSTWGTGLVELRQLYRAVMLPQIAYGCSVWYAPQKERRQTRKMTAEMTRIQFHAARVISGAYRMTSALALDVELFVLPIHLQLEKRAYEAAINIRTVTRNPTPNAVFVHTAPITAPRVRELYRSGTAHKSPLRGIDDNLGTKLGTNVFERLEVIEPHAVEPWWTPPPIDITADSQEAMAKHNEAVSGPEAPLAIYSDGSGINGKIGAAAVAPSLSVHDQAYLGKVTTASVYVAELTGILMAVGIAMRASRPRAIVFTDNQAALKTIREPKRQSGQYIVRRIIHRLADADRNGVCVKLQRIPAHRGIRGYELADQLAKEATGLTQARGRRGRLVQQDSDHSAAMPDFLRHLKSAATRRIRRHTEDQWRTDWERETRGRTTYALSQGRHVTHFDYTPHTTRPSVR